jgi:hypothetical protein
MVGLPYESTITIVWPLPSNPSASKEETPYAVWISCGL